MSDKTPENKPKKSKRGRPSNSKRVKKLIRDGVARCGNLKGAIDHINKNTKTSISYPTIRRYRKEDPEFEEDLLNAFDEYNDVIRQASHKYGVEGHDEPELYQGGLVRDDEGNIIYKKKFVTEYVKNQVNRLPENQVAKESENSGFGDIHVHFHQPPALEKVEDAPEKSIENKESVTVDAEFTEISKKEEVK